MHVLIAYLTLVVTQMINLLSDDSLKYTSCGGPSQPPITEHKYWDYNLKAK